MKDWSNVFTVSAVIALVVGVIGFFLGSVPGLLLIPVAFGLWFLADVCRGLAEVFEYYAAANKARRARAKAANNRS